MTVAVIASNTSKIEQDFLKFDADHPEVYVELVRISRRLRAQGWERFGIKTVWEVCRYQSMLGNTAGKGPKLNNNFTALYARKIMDNEPDLAGVFKTRKLGVPSHTV